MGIVQLLCPENGFDITVLAFSRLNSRHTTLVRWDFGLQDLLGPAQFNHEVVVSGVVVQFDLVQWVLGIGVAVVGTTPCTGSFPLSNNLAKRVRCEVGKLLYDGAVSSFLSFF